MNLELFDDYFKRDYCNYIERFLCLKMKELVLLRQEIIDNSFMQEIEKEISLDVMKYVDHVDNELEQGCRSIDFIYREWLGEIAGICKVMDYKMICCSRYASEMNRVNWKPVKEIIKKEIAHNPYLGYKELVTKDLSLDIEIELEYLIESEQLIRRKPNHKNPRYRWEARIK